MYHSATNLTLSIPPPQTPRPQTLKPNLAGTALRHLWARRQLAGTCELLRCCCARGPTPRPAWQVQGLQHLNSELALLGCDNVAGNEGCGVWQFRVLGPMGSAFEHLMRCSVKQLIPRFRVLASGRAPNVSYGQAPGVRFTGLGVWG